MSASALIIVASAGVAWWMWSGSKSGALGKVTQPGSDAGTVSQGQHSVSMVMDSVKSLTAATRTNEYAPPPVALTPTVAAGGVNAPKLAASLATTIGGIFTGNAPPLKRYDETNMPIATVGKSQPNTSLQAANLAKTIGGIFGNQKLSGVK